MRFEKSSSTWFLQYSEISLLFMGQKRFLTRQDREANSGTGNGEGNGSEWAGPDTRLGLGRLATQSARHAMLALGLGVQAPPWVWRLLKNKIVMKQKTGLGFYSLHLRGGSAMSTGCLPVKRGQKRGLEPCD